MKPHAIIICLFMSCQLSAQYGPSAEDFLKGRSGINDLGGHSILLNPAGLAELQNWVSDLSARQPYGVNKVYDVAIGIAHGWKNLGGMSLVFRRFGNEIFQDQYVSLSYGRLMIKGFRVGVGMDVHQKSVEKYGAKWTFGFQIGLQTDLSSQLSIAAHLINPSGKIAPQTGETEYAAMHVELMYVPDESVKLYAGIQKGILNSAGFNIGTTYQWNKRVIIIAGIRTTPVHASAGLGFWWKKIRFSMGADMHPDLGVSPIIGVSVDRSRK